MKYLLRDSIYTIVVDMVLQPIFYLDTDIMSSIQKDSKSRRYYSDNNASRIINGPLSEYGEELESPIKEEYEQFIEDCKSVILDNNLEIISSSRSQDSNKSEYIIVFGLSDRPYGRLVYKLRVSDHPLDNVKISSEDRDKVLEYLQINNILDGSATAAGIDFAIKKVQIGSVHNDTWDRALNRLYNVVKIMKNRITRLIDNQ